VLVGNAAAFTKQLAGVGFSSYEQVEIEELDLLSANLKKTGTRTGGDVAGWAGAAGRANRDRVAYAQAPVGVRPQLPPLSDEGAKAMALLHKAIAAKGGLDKLRSVKTIIVKQTLTNPAADSVTSVETTAYIQYPDRFRTETLTPGGVNVQGYDGAHVWVRDPRGSRELPDAVARDAKTTPRRHPIALLIHAAAGALTARLLPDVKDAKGRVNHALELATTDLSPIVLQIDPETSQINKLTFVADAPGRPIVED